MKLDECQLEKAKFKCLLSDGAFVIMRQKARVAGLLKTESVYHKITQNAFVITYH
jgi:hypothetical protein